MAGSAAKVWSAVRNHLRGAGATLVLLAGVWLFLWQVDGHYPMKNWLFFRYASYWALSALFLAASSSAGHAILVRLLGRSLPLREHFTLALALGVMAFALGWFVLGLLQLYSAITFFVWPLVLLAAGSPASWRFIRRYRRHRRPRTSESAGLTWLFERLLLSLGVVALLLMYAPIMLPDNVAYDSRWYHLAIAERYSMTGGISTFPEGWFPAATPHLASYLYSWAFSIPKRALYDQIELAQHLEYALFAATLVGIPALVRRLLRGESRARASWVAIFAFPGIFLYDSSLHGAADHIAAFWAVPIFLTLLRAWPALDRRYVVLCALMVAGPLLTKYTAIGLIVLPSLGLALRSQVLWLRALRQKQPGAARPLLEALLFGAVVLGVTAPHWLGNLIIHHNPVYPFAHALFPSRPWTPDTPDRFWAFVGPEWQAERSWKGVEMGFTALATFSFIPNDWAAFHRDVPVFGSLLTLTVPCLLFLRRSWRIVALYGATHVAIFTWYWMFHQDRYLQAFVPWMAAGVAAVAMRLWQLGLPARLGVLLLGSAQLVWGADVPFIPGHAMIGTTPLLNAVQLMSTGYRGIAKERFDQFGDFGKLRSLLPKGSKLLLHEEHINLGVGVPVVSDWVPWQGGIAYGQSPAPAELYDLFKGMGVTHLMWTNQLSRGSDSLGGDLAFHLFVRRYGQNTRQLAGHVLAQMPAARPPAADFHDRVLVLDCSPNSYPAGLYRLRDLKLTVLPQPRPPSDFPQPLERVTSKTDLSGYPENIDAVVHNPSCFKMKLPLAGLGFVQVASRWGLNLWVRSAPPTH